MMWIVNATSPDILNAVREVAPHAHNPIDVRNRRAALKVVECLKNPRENGITYVKFPLRPLVACGYSSFAEDIQDRPSVSGGVVVYSGGVVCWVSPDSTLCDLELDGE